MSLGFKEGRKKVKKALDDKAFKILAILNTYKECLTTTEISNYCNRYYRDFLRSRESIENRLKFLINEGYVVERAYGKKDTKGRYRVCYQLKSLDEHELAIVKSSMKNLYLKYWLSHFEYPLIVVGASKYNFDVCDAADTSDALAAFEILAKILLHNVLHDRGYRLQDLLGIPTTSAWINWFGDVLKDRDLIIVGSSMVNYFTDLFIKKGYIDIKFEFDCTSKRVSRIIVKGKSYGQDHGVIVLMPNVLDPKRDRVAMIIAGATAYATSSTAYSLIRGKLSKELDKLDNCNAVVVKAVRDEHRQGFYSDAEIVDEYLL